MIFYCNTWNFKFTPVLFILMCCVFTLKGLWSMTSELYRNSPVSFIIFTAVSFFLVFFFFLFFLSERRLANKHVLKDMFIFKKKPNSDQTSRQPHPSSSMISYLGAWLIILMAPYPFWFFKKESSFCSYSPGCHTGEHCTCVMFFCLFYITLSCLPQALFF